MPPVEHHISGRDYWLSVEQFAQTPEFRERVGREFPDYDPDQMTEMPRRRFLKMMGASMALAGLTGAGCRRWPREVLAPFAKDDPQRTPGVTERFATVMELGGVGTGLLVSSYDGRPIKVEGNPLHQFSKGATDAIAQASVLELYDPDRSRYPIRRGENAPEDTTWDAFAEFASKHFGGLREQGGKGFAVLSEAASGPTSVDMKRRLLKAFPGCRWVEYEPISRDAAIEGSRLAFGRPLRAVLHLDKAKFIASFDADLLSAHPAKVRLARDWAAGRKSADQGEMNRMAIAESGYSITGSVADHRLAARPARIERLLAAVAQSFGVSGPQNPVDLNDRERAFVTTTADQLRRHGAQALVVTGETMSPAAHALAQRINAAIGAVGKTITFVSAPQPDRPSHVEAIRELADAMRKGEIDTLLMLGGNPVYDAPADVGFGDALAQVGASAQLSNYVNETSARCTWHLPRTHYLEAWGDARAWDGTISVCQPLIRPLYDGKSTIELLAMIAGDKLEAGYDLVRRSFREVLPSGDFEANWRRALHDGLVSGSAWPAVNPEPTNGELPALLPEQGDGFDVVFAADAGLHDGRFANNGWLQEAPDPMSKTAWDNPALMAQADADRLGISTGDVVTIASGERSLDVATYVMPGQPEGVVSLALGYGRTAAGNIGNDVGFATYDLRTSTNPYVLSGVSVTKTGRRYELAVTQDHHAIDGVAEYGTRKRVGGRGESGKIIREATLDEYNADPHFAHRVGHGGNGLQLFQPPAEFNDPHAWGMAVDLNSCTGCNACVLACQAENNVPIVGKDQVSVGREMHWLRIDRYFKGEPDANPQVVHQPMMCVHCENAPCEQVCPVAATVHDSEGLNTMVYNRCVGTRYCSNNCPYKVRRFNYFDYHSADPRGTPKPHLGMPDSQQDQAVGEIKRMVYNPDVTVRMRGVMEKCTYCTQRIAAAKIDRRNKGEDVQDGDIVTACQQACPTQAIVFGNLNDPNSQVRKLQENNRAYGVLTNLNTRPRTKYLAKVRNPAEGKA